VQWQLVASICYVYVMNYTKQKQKNPVAFSLQVNYTD
jgi:hypothetical protein